MRKNEVCENTQINVANLISASFYGTEGGVQPGTKRTGSQEQQFTNGAPSCFLVKNRNIHCWFSVKFQGRWKFL